jgi:methylenetetrahydrofolate dehydrogenase (NADP+)/methenyltetrahydrofolate cyclohydrolase
MPLPQHINSQEIINAIDPIKDVDGFTITNIGQLASGNINKNTIVPCTPLACLHLIKNTIGQNIAGKNAIVIGKSNIVGRPLANLLLIEGCTVTMAHSKTVNLKTLCLANEIIVSATGVVKLITGDMLPENATVIDVGINKIDGVINGDCDKNCMEENVNITPVPGGVGPNTIAFLMLNVLKCYKLQHNINF